MIDIGSRLRQERKRLGLSQKEMGELGGVAANAQGKYESGERAPRADYLAALARAGVDVLFVLTNRRAVRAQIDSAFSKFDALPINSELLLIDVQQAVRHFVSTLEELSNNCEVGGNRLDAVNHR